MYVGKGTESYKTGKAIAIGLAIRFMCAHTIHREQEYETKRERKGEHLANDMRNGSQPVLKASCS